MAFLNLEFSGNLERVAYFRIIQSVQIAFEFILSIATRIYISSNGDYLTNG